jgi:hypothetical protein
MRNQKAKHNFFPTLPNFSRPRIPFCVTRKSKTKVVLQEYSDTSKQIGDMKISRKRTVPALDAPRPSSNLCARTYSRPNANDFWRVDAAVCAVDRDSQVRSKEVVFRLQLTFGVCGWNSRQTDRAIDDNAGMFDGNEGKSSQVVV